MHRRALTPLATRFSPTALLVLAASAASATFTLLVTALPSVSFAYRSVEAHMAIETAAALTTGLAAVLVHGRFRRTQRRSDLVLFAAMLLFAGTNALFSVLPPLVGAGRDSALATWAPVVGRFASSFLFAWAAFARDDRVDWRRSPPAVVVGLVAAFLTAILVGTAALADVLPDPIDPALSPESSTRPVIVGSPVVLTQQALSMVLFAAAAYGFLRRAERTSEELTSWLAVAAVLGAFARLNYFLFPSLYSEWVYTGDLLRLGFFVVLCVGAGREIMRAQRAESRAAVLEDRRRMAREIHDGLAQELAFIATHSRRLGRHPNGAGADRDRLAQQIGDAAQRALDESRAAIDVLTTRLDEPLDAAIVRAAENAGDRYGVHVRAALVSGLDVPPATRDSFMRIVREAVTNAARHGQARTVRVELDGPNPIVLRIADDGRGFDPRQHSGSGFGLTSMRERAEALGGTFSIESADQGTTVEVQVP